MSSATAPPLPPPLPSPVPAALPRWAWLPVLAAVALLLASRRPDALLNPQFWAEDGSFFFGEAYLEGAAALLKGYGGYYHLLPRLVAGLGDTFLPLAWAPGYYAFAALTLSVASAAIVLDRRLPLAGKPALALALVLTPDLGFEVALTLCNAQWLTALALLATLCKDAPQPGAPGARAQTALDVAVVVLVGLTGPFGLLFLPVFALRVLLRPNRHHALLLLLLAATAAPQLFNMLRNASGVILPEVFSFERLSQLLGLRQVFVLFWPHDLIGLPAAAPLLAWLALMSGMAWLLRRQPALLLMLLGAHLLLVASTLARSMVWWENMLRDTRDGSRYDLIPHVIVAWVLVQGACRERGAARAVCALLIVALVVSSALRQWQHGPREDLQWRQWVERIGHGEAVRVPIHPPTWVIEIPARGAAR